MESVTIKMEDSLAKEMNKVMIPLYSTKTEFIREAIRDKIESIRKRNAYRIIQEMEGISKNKMTDKEFKKHREEVAKKYMKLFDINPKEI